jgi:DNA repair protein RadC
MYETKTVPHERSIVLWKGGVSMLYEIVSERKVKYNSKIKNPDDMYDLLKRYAGTKKEQFIVITLNGNHEPISIRLVGSGLINRVLVHPREVFYPAINDLAATVILCHNHPSGDLTPSDEDIGVTIRLVAAGIIIGIRVLDHLIIGKSGYYSFAKNDRMPRENVIMGLSLEDLCEGNKNL